MAAKETIARLRERIAVRRAPEWPTVIADPLYVATLKRPLAPEEAPNKMARGNSKGDRGLDRKGMRMRVGSVNSPARLSPR